MPRSQAGLSRHRAVKRDGLRSRAGQRGFLVGVGLIVKWADLPSDSAMIYAESGLQSLPAKRGQARSLRAAGD